MQKIKQTMKSGKQPAVQKVKKLHERFTIQCNLDGTDKRSNTFEIYARRPNNVFAVENQHYAEVVEVQEDYNVLCQGQDEASKRPWTSLNE